MTYEDVARFAQQGGTLYFMLIFLAGVVWALMPRNKARFDRAARIPLEEDETDGPR